MTHVTRRLTAKNQDQLRNLTLGSRVWDTFTFFTVAVAGGEVVEVDESLFEDVDDLTLDDDDVDDIVDSDITWCQ